MRCLFHLIDRCYRYSRCSRFSRFSSFPHLKFLIFHLSFLIFSPSLPAAAQVVEHEQHAFPEDIPAGGYSGITWLGDSLYAVVSDNLKQDGFFRFSIQLDSLGDITSARCIDFVDAGIPGRDSEGVAWCKNRGTLFVSGEKDNEVMELSLEGKPTGKKLLLPEIIATATNNYGLEALSYNAETHRFWTTTESTLPGDGPQATPTNGVENKLRLLSFDDSLQLIEQYWYVMDKPIAEAEPQHFAHGVSALAAMDDGRLLVMEREFAVPESKIGAYVNSKIYVVKPTPCTANNKKASCSPIDKKTSCSPIDKKAPCSPPLKKELLTEWSTAIGLLDFNIANYEGMCLGPKLKNGAQVIILIADSQNQYAGILQDYVKSLVIF